MLFAPTSYAKMFGSDERLIQFWLSLYPLLLFPCNPLSSDKFIIINVTGWPILCYQPRQVLKKVSLVTFKLCLLCL